MPLQPLGLNALLSPLSLSPLNPSGWGQFIRLQRPLGQTIQPLGQSFQSLQPPSPLSPFLQTSLLENLAVDDVLPSSTMVNPPKTRARFANSLEASQMVQTRRSPSSSPSSATLPLPISESQQYTAQERTLQRQPLGSLKPLAQASDFQASPLEPERPSATMPVSIVSDRVVQPTIVQPTIAQPKAVQPDGEPSATVPPAPLIQPSITTEDESLEAAPEADFSTSAPTNTIQPKVDTQPQRTEAELIPAEDGSNSDLNSSQVTVPVAPESIAVEASSFSQLVEPPAIQGASSDVVAPRLDIASLDAPVVAVSNLSSEGSISTAAEPNQARLEEVSESIEPVSPNIPSELRNETSIAPIPPPSSNAVLETATPSITTPVIQPASQENPSTSETLASTPAPSRQPSIDQVAHLPPENTGEGLKEIVSAPEAVLQLRVDPSTVVNMPLAEAADLQASETHSVPAESTTTALSTSEKGSESSDFASPAKPVMETLTRKEALVQPRLETQVESAVNTGSIASESASPESAIREPITIPDAIEGSLQGSTIADAALPQLHLKPLSAPKPLAEPSNFLTPDSNDLSNIQASRTAPELPTALARLVSDRTETMQVDESKESSNSVLPELQTAPEAWENLSELMGETRPASSHVTRQPLSTTERLDSTTINQPVLDETNFDVKTDSNSPRSRLEPEQVPVIQRSEVSKEAPDAWSDLSELISRKPKANSDHDSEDARSAEDRFESVTLTAPFSLSDRTSDDRRSDSITLASPAIQTAPQPLAAAQGSQTSAVDQQQLEQLAHIVYRFMQPQFMVNQERRGGFCLTPPLWSRSLILNNESSTTATAAGQQTARASPDDVSTTDASLQTLATEVYTQLQQRFEVDRERHGKLCTGRLF